MKDQKQTKIFYRIFILTAIFFLICLLYVFRLAGIVLTEEAPEIRDHTYTYVTVKAARGRIYDRNGVPLVTNKYVYNLVLDDQTLPRNSTAIARSQERCLSDSTVSGE